MSAGTFTQLNYRYGPFLTPGDLRHLGDIIGGTFKDNILDGRRVRIENGFSVKRLLLERLDVFKVIEDVESVVVGIFKAVPLAIIHVIIEVVLEILFVDVGGIHAIGRQLGSGRREEFFLVASLA